MKKGITLIETLVVILIISILATISLIHLDNFITKTQLRTISYALDATIHSTRTKAYSTERTHWLIYENNTFNVYQDDGDETLTSNDVKLEQLSIEIPVKHTIEFTNENIVKYGIKFNTNKCWWPAGAILLSNSNTTNKYKLTFPVNSQRCLYYELINNEYTLR